MPRRCPICQTINYDDSEGAVCINCGAELPPVEEAGIDIDEIEDEDYDRDDVEIDDDSRAPDESGDDMDRGGFYCPDCGSFIPPGQNYCDFCGRTFEEGELPELEEVTTGLEEIESLAEVEREFVEESESDSVENEELADEEMPVEENIEDKETEGETEIITEEPPDETEEEPEERSEEAHAQEIEEEKSDATAAPETKESSADIMLKEELKGKKKRQGRKKDKKKKKDRKEKQDETALDELPEDEDEVLPKEGGLYYKLSPISFFFFMFLSIFLLIEFLMVLFNISIYIPSMFMALAPIIGGFVREGVLFVALLVATVDMALHYWDRRMNIGISIVITFVMIISIGINIGVSAGATAVDILSQFVLLGLLGIMVIIDLLCFLNYPSVLEDPGRAGFETFLESQGEIEQIIEEEEEKLRLKDQEIEQIRSQLEMLESEIEEEEEKLRIKDEEISAISSQLEKVQEELMEEEEKLRVRDEELDTYVQQELEKRQEEMMLEEEEKLRMKEEEVIRVRNDLEIQKKLHEEAREKLRMKEQELMTLKTELEKQIKERLEEEERLKLKETAARLEQMEKKKRVLFPFTAIVGQEKMKKALILNAIYPEIGGVLIRGQKGTAKSVSVRALADVLPDIEVTGCRFNCDPTKPEEYCSECKMRAEKDMLQVFSRPVQVVDLPLNITEDRLLGSIDIEKILHEGTRAFEPGILAEAHRGILYVDEINLLDDYIVDILLDAASSGRVVIEREGISIAHPARFIIVGSMNPEEGELRPQILDRIALQTDVVGIHDVEKRIEIIRRREEFSRDPEGFREKYRPAQEELKAKITRAREILKNVSTPERIYNLIGQLCIDFSVDGHRADIIIERAARANAAFEGRLEVTAEDVITAAEMALPHRMRRKPYEGEEFNIEALRRWVSKRELESE